jgi:hypothetical protein
MRTSLLRLAYRVRLVGSCVCLGSLCPVFFVVRGDDSQGVNSRVSWSIGGGYVSRAAQWSFLSGRLSRSESCDHPYTCHGGLPISPFLPPTGPGGCLENRLISSCDWHFHWCTRANVVWFPIQRNCWIPRKKHTFRNLVNQYATHPVLGAPESSLDTDGAPRHAPGRWHAL